MGSKEKSGKFAKPWEVPANTVKARFRFSPLGDQLSQMIFRMEVYSRGRAYLNLHILRSTTQYRTGKECRMYRKLLEKTKILVHFDSNANNDGIKEEKVAKTVIHIKY